MNQPIESLPLLVPARSVIGASSAIGAAHTTDRANSTALERKVALVGFAREDLKRKLFPPSLSFFFLLLVPTSVLQVLRILSNAALLRLRV